MGACALVLVLRAWTTSTIARFLLILMIKMVSGMIKQAKIPNKSELLNHIDLQVSDGTTEPCGPEPGSTHANQPCSNDCR